MTDQPCPFKDPLLVEWWATLGAEWQYRYLAAGPHPDDPLRVLYGLQRFNSGFGDQAHPLAQLIRARLAGAERARVLAETLEQGNAESAERRDGARRDRAIAGRDVARAIKGAFDHE